MFPFLRGASTVIHPAGHMIVHPAQAGHEPKSAVSLSFKIILASPEQAKPMRQFAAF
jgi:hypothetical protein